MPSRCSYPQKRVLSSRIKVNSLLRLPVIQSADGAERQFAVPSQLQGCQRKSAVARREKCKTRFRDGFNTEKAVGARGVQAGAQGIWRLHHGAATMRSDE